MANLILIRHGESEWNKKGLWTGLKDVSLTKKGIDETRAAAEAIRNIRMDVAYTSVLKRAKETLEVIKNSLQIKNLPTYEASSLNERDYGDFTGKNKWSIKKEYGEEKFFLIRRSWDYPIQNGETLKDVYNRVVPCYTDSILPQLKEGKNVLVVAHGNSLRALVKYLENIKDEDISKFEFGIGDVYVYEVNEDGKIVSKKILLSSQNVP